MTLQMLAQKIPWWAKALSVLCLVLVAVNECQARDRSIAQAALWKVSWDSTARVKHLTDEKLKAAQDTLRLLVTQAARKEDDFKANLRELTLRKSKVVVIHDTVPGQPLSAPDTIEQADLPIVKSCSQALEAKVSALSSCQLMNLLLQEQHVQDTIALRLAFRKPKTSSRARDITTGAVIGAAFVAVLLHYAH